MLNNIPDHAQFEADKRAVYKHPLFSLLAFLLEKCENATQGNITSRSDDKDNNNGKSLNTEKYSSADDINEFVKLLQKEKRPLLTNNLELDSLMIKALQVLRIHILELEKVQELCKDFCNRYIACLRGKMQSENLLRSNYLQEVDGSESGGLIERDNDILSSHNSDIFDFPTLNKSEFSLETPTIPMNERISGEESDMQNSLNPKIAMPLCENFSDNSTEDSLDEIDSEFDSGNGDIASNNSNSGSYKNKRCVLPKHATVVMKTWLFQHLMHPYPTDEEKKQLASQTNLTVLQVSNWFINARRRILNPMMEEVNDVVGLSNSAAYKENIEMLPIMKQDDNENIFNLKEDSNSNLNAMKES